VEREHGELEPHADDDEAISDTHRAVVGEALKTIGYVSHVEAAGHHVDQPHADHEEGRPQRSHHQIAVCGH
jgi:hypothetical protein